MSHSLCRSIFHIVFSTKERCRLIPKASLDTTFAYIAGVARNHQIRVFSVGGMQDHVHALVELPTEMAPADAVRTLKCNSSRWLRDSVRLFNWQQGYAAFSVSPSQTDRVVRYIARQAEHHARYSFEDELRAILKAAGMAMPIGLESVAPEGALDLQGR